MGTKDTRTKQLTNTTFWHLILPILVLCLLLFVLFVVYTMPDWALECPSGLELVKRAASH